MRQRRLIRFENYNVQRKRGRRTVMLRPASVGSGENF